MPKDVRVRCEKGDLKPRDSAEENIDELIMKYRGILGKSSVEEYLEREGEAQAQ